MGNLQVAKVQKCITLNHTEGFPTHMARQRHYFSKCVMEQKKRKAEGRSESRGEAAVQAEGETGTVRPGPRVVPTAPPAFLPGCSPS